MKFVSTLIVALVVMFSAASAGAATIGFVGAPSAITESGTFTVDIVADLTGGFDISGFSFNVLYDPTLLKVTGEAYTFASDVLDLDGTFSFPFGGGELAPGVYNLANAADFGVSDFSAQSDVITLASLTFMGLGDFGVSTLDIGFDFIDGLFDPVGMPLETTVIPTSVILAPAPVGLLLIASGLVGLVGIRRVA